MIDDKIEELKKLLLEFPEMNDSGDFDFELHKRREILNEIRTEIDVLYKNIEKDWVIPAWISVKERIVIIDGSTRNNNNIQDIDWFTCPRCGFDLISDKSRYCSGCGAKIIQK